MELQATMEVRAIKVGKRFRRDLGDIKSLAVSFDEIGMLQPVVVDTDDNLIAGRRRIEAWKKSKYADKPIPIYRVDLKQIIRGEWAENDPALRKTFTPSEAVAIGRALRNILLPIARDNKAKGGHRIKIAVPMNVRDRAAQLCGMSPKTFAKALTVVTEAERNPALAPLVAEMDRTGKVDGAYRKLPNNDATFTRDINGRTKKISSIFYETKIGKVPLVKLTAPELRWLGGFFGELMKHIPIAPCEGMSAAQLFTSAEVRAALDAARCSREQQI
jgi:hypothetical protein